MNRRAWPLFLAITWLLPPALALELVVRIADVVGQRDLHRQMIASSAQMPVMHPATQEEAQLVKEIAHAPLLREAKESAESKRDLSPSTTDDFWALYQASEPDERAARTAQKGEYWRLLDGKGETEIAFGIPEVEWQHNLRTGMEELAPGTKKRFTSEYSPLWDYEMSHLRSSPTAEAAKQSLFKIRSLTEQLSIERLRDLYDGKSNRHLLAFGFLYEPNHPWPVVTDQFGFPNPPVTIPKPPRTVRILCIGGSTMEDFGQEHMRTTAQLGTLLNADGMGWNIEVLNCAISSSGSDELRRHTQDYLNYEPDLVIYYEGINDLMRTIARHRSEDLWWFQRLGLYSRALPNFFNAAFAPNIEDFGLMWQKATRVNLVAIQLAMRDAGVSFAAMSFVYPREHLLSFREWNFLRSNAFHTWGSGIASYQGITQLLDKHNEMLYSLCNERDIGYIPLAENFDHGMLHYIDLCHLSRVGNLERARVMHSWVKPWVAQFIAQQ